MKIRFLPILLFLSSALFAQNHSDTELETRPPQNASIRFVQNKNQWDPEVLYRADLPGGYLFLRQNALQFSFYDDSPIERIHAQPANTSKSFNPDNMIKAHSYLINFKGASDYQTKSVQGLQPLSEKRNYFLGKDPKKWGQNVQSFQKMYYHQLYPGIDMQMYARGQILKYEFILEAGSDPAQIKMDYEGGVKLFIQDENLIIETSLSQVTEKKPYCYQLIRGEEVPVPSRFVLNGQQVSFEFPEGYNKDYALVIDPELVFSTYSGSFSDNWGSSATFDSLGNVYASGIAFGVNFPVTVGAFQLNFSGIADVAIHKYDPTRSGNNTLVYATYLGGLEGEFPHSMVANSNNELIIFGTTGSADFPVTAMAFDTTFNGGNPNRYIDDGNGTNQVVPLVEYNNGGDMFITVLSEDGSQLQASTYIGGSDNDGTNSESVLQSTIKNYGDQVRGEVITDQDDFIYIASNTNSLDFPLVNAFNNTLGGTIDGVALKLSPDLSTIVWSTYLGGDDFDAAFSIKLNENNDIYVCGATRSQDLGAFTPPDTLAPGFQNRALGDDDGFIIWMNNDGQPIQMTFIGTVNADQVFLLDFDSENNVYVAGQTFGNYPVSAGVYTNTNSRQFIQKLSPDLSSGILSTVVGSGRSTPDINLTAFLVSECGNVYLAGWGGSSGAGGLLSTTGFNLNTEGLPIGGDPFSSTTDGSDFYIMILERDFQSLLYATFFGGNQSDDHVDGGTSRFSKDGVIYQAVCASCRTEPTNDFPTTANAFSRVDNSNNCNTAVFKFDIGSLRADFEVLDSISGLRIDNACDFPLTLELDYTGQGATSLTWIVNGELVGNTPEVYYPIDTLGNFVIELIAENTVSCLVSDTIRKIFPVSMIALNDISPDTTICQGDSFELFAQTEASNAFEYRWSPATGLSDPNIANPIAQPNVSTTYILEVVDENGCKDTDTTNVRVIQPLRDDFDILNFTNVSVNRDCVPARVSLVYDVAGAGTPSWTWTVDGFGTFVDQDTVEVTYDEIGEYTIRLEALRGDTCPESVSIEKVLTVVDVAVELPEDTTICFGERIEISALVNDEVSYRWSPNEALSSTTSPNPIANPLVTTTYFLDVTNADGCMDRDSVTIHVVEEIVPSFEVEVQSSCGQAPVISFRNLSQNVLEYLWTIRRDSTIIQTYTSSDPGSFMPPRLDGQEISGEYEVSLWVATGRCQEEIIQTIMVEDNRVPNIITPNGDQYNQTFFVSDLDNYSFEVYNRWGNTIFKTDNYQNDWGEGVEPGVYFYQLVSPSGVECRGWIEVSK